MEQEFTIDEEIKGILKASYTDLECKTLVNCIMSDNISPEDAIKSITALGVNINLSHSAIEKSEIDEEGELEIYKTSEFQMFLDQCVDTLLFDEDSKSFLKFYKKTLIELEKYELLHILKLEKTWNI